MLFVHGNFLFIVLLKKRLLILLIIVSVYRLKITQLSVKTYSSKQLLIFATATAGLTALGRIASAPRPQVEITVILLIQLNFLSMHR